MKRINHWIHILFILYLYTLVKIILFKFHDPAVPYLLERMKTDLESPELVFRRMQQGNLIPLGEITRTLQNVSSHGLLNLFGNIGLFIPFGIFLGLLGAKKGISTGRVLVTVFAASLCLESAQAVFSIGCFDVDDLILNSLGGLIGFAGFQLSVKLKKASVPTRRHEKGNTRLSRV